MTKGKFPAHSAKPGKDQAICVRPRVERLRRKGFVGKAEKKRESRIVVLYYSHSIEGASLGESSGIRGTKVRAEKGLSPGRKKVVTSLDFFP